MGVYGCEGEQVCLKEQKGMSLKEEVGVSQGWVGMSLRQHVSPGTQKGVSLMGPYEHVPF